MWTDRVLEIEIKIDGLELRVDGQHGESHRIG
jgi:hypothetical protein